jgi:predicted HTH transcriptional regulator
LTIFCEKYSYHKRIYSYQNKFCGFVSFAYLCVSKRIGKYKGTEYYQALRSCQAQRPNEDVAIWIFFFLNALKNIQSQLMVKLEQSDLVSQLSLREKSILTTIQNYSGIKSGEIAEKLSIPNPTVKRILSDLQTKGLIEKQGNGRGTSYLAK